jgi:hypothetical protein
LFPILSGARIADVAAGSGALGAVRRWHEVQDILPTVQTKLRTPPFARAEEQAVPDMPEETSKLTSRATC